MIAVLFVAIFLIPGSWREVPSGAWEPNKATLSTIHSAIKPFVIEQASANNEKLPDWSGYAFEYQGQVKAGHKFVFISAVWRADEHKRTVQELTIPEPLSPADERFYIKQFHFISDGGTHAFRVSYDPKTRRFFDLAFNGSG